jgi:hypothetical protein
MAVEIGRWTFTAFAFVAPTLEFWLVSRIVADIYLVENPPIHHLETSPVRRLLVGSSGTARLFAPGANLPSVLGAAVVPPYLTFAPAAYFDPSLKLPPDAAAGSDATTQAEAVRKQVEWLRQSGVTHILSFEPLDIARWPVRLLWQGVDPLLNAAWARRDKPLFLYELQGSRGRVAWESSTAGQQVRVLDYQPTRVVIEASSRAGGRLVLTDLMYPGWAVMVDGAAAQPEVVEQLYRAVVLSPGTHTVIWSYQPRAVYWGILVSALAWLALAALGAATFLRSRRPIR